MKNMYPVIPNGGGNGKSEGIYNPVIDPLVGRGEGVKIIQLFINNFITLALVIGAIVAFALFFIGAINWITSGGDREKLQAAQKKVTNAIIGLVVLFAIYAIIRFIGSVLGIDLLTLPLPIIGE